MSSNRQKSLELYERAVSVIPAGVYGHTSPAATLPIAFPYYAESAEGCTFTDVDGNRYIDFMCAYGPILLGYNHPEIEAAAREEKARGGLYNHPAKVMVELAELLTERIDFADWAVFGKNGSDMTTWALQVARQHTGRKKVLTVKGAYHGVDAWTNPSPGGVIEEDRLHIHHFSWNDLSSFEQQVNRYPGEIAAVMLTPFHHPAFAANVLPGEGFFEGIQKICNANDILIILDDIRCGFRLHEAGSHKRFPIEPDMSCYCKALGNGYPISATVGKDHLQAAAGKVFLTGSYWSDAVSMATAKRCVELVAELNIPEKLNTLGKRLITGLEEAAANAGLKVTGHEPYAMPYLTFEDDPDLRKMQRFSEICANEGVIFHPHHNWFISAAHTTEAIDDAIEIASKAFQAVASEFNS